MCAAESIPCRFDDERAALTARMQSSGDRRAHYALFDALKELEDRARTEGASAVTLRKIAETRFLVGILREAFRPRPVATLRTLLRMRGPGEVRKTMPAGVMPEA